MLTHHNYIILLLHTAVVYLISRQIPRKLRITCHMSAIPIVTMHWTPPGNKEQEED